MRRMATGVFGCHRDGIGTRLNCVGWFLYLPLRV